MLVEFISVLVFLNQTHLSAEQVLSVLNICTDSFSCLISLILTSFYKNGSPSFLPPLYDFIYYFNVSSWTFQLSSILTFGEQLVYLIYSLLQLHGIKYMQRLVWVKCLWRVEPFLNIILMLYRPHILWIFSNVSFMYGRPMQI